MIVGGFILLDSSAAACWRRWWPYAFGWQQVIKHLPLTTAYANKAITVVWGILLGFLLFGESITLRQFIGAAVIIVGIVLFVRADNEGEGGQ